MTEEDQEEDGGDQNDGRVKKSLVDDGGLLSRLEEESLDQPGSSEADEDIEDVAADGVAEYTIESSLTEVG